MFKKTISLILSVSLILIQPVFAQGVGELNIGKYLSQMSTVKSDSFRPPHLRYISYDIASNDFQLLLDQGNALKGLSPKGTVPNKQLQDATQELFNYFLIGLSLPNEKFWVNLRPDAPEQIIDPELEKTDMGKIMLEADLQLKKDTAGWTSPQNPEGKEYWDKLYKRAGELFGTENITIPTITRPWIVPGEVIIRESEDSAYIYKANLKVMLEEDYLTGRVGSRTAPTYQQYTFSDPRLKELNKYSTELIKELILPKLTQEINTSKKYAQLRQVFFSLILSRWFKDRYRSQRTEDRAQSTEKSSDYLKLIDAGNLDNLTSKDHWSKDYYFSEYKKSFQQGEYNLKEQITTPTGQVIRSYVSGGIEITGTSSPIIKDSFTSRQQRNFKVLLIAAGALFLSYVAISSYSIHLKYQHQQLEENKLDKIKGEIARILEDCKDMLDKGLIDTLTYTLIDSNLAHYNALDKEQLIKKINNILEDPHVKKTPASWGVCFWLSHIRTKLESSSSLLAPEEGASSAIVLKEEFEKVKQAFLAEFKKLNEQFLLKEENRMVYDRIKDNEKLKDMAINNGPFTAGIAESKDFRDLIIMAKVLLGNASEESLVADILKELKEQLISIIRPIHIRLQGELDKHIQEYASKEPMASRLKYILAGISFDESIFRLPLVLRYSVVLAVTEDMRKYTDKQKAQDFSAKADAWETLNSFIDTYSSSSSLTEALPQTVGPSLAPGGIDFRKIEYLAKPMGSFQGLDLRLPLLSKAELEGIDINRELAAIEQMVNARIDVSTDRLKRLLAAMSQKDAFSAQRETQLLPLLLRLCWLKEERGAETTPDFRAVLLIADTGLFVEQGNAKHSLN